MTTKAHFVKKTASKPTLTRAKARAVVRKAKSAAKRSPKKSAAWQKGGKQWERFLGHFGPTR